MPHATPSAAARSLVGRAVNGWRFFVDDQASKRTLRGVLRAYIETLSVEVDDDEGDDDGDDDAA